MVAGWDHSNVWEEGKILINEPGNSILTIKLQSGSPLFSSSLYWKLSGKASYKHKTWQFSVTRGRGMEVK